jgi:hypothetical protein
LFDQLALDEALTGFELKVEYGPAKSLDHLLAQWCRDPSHRFSGPRFGK